MRKMLNESSKHIRAKLEVCLKSVGDMALKRRATRIIQELELRNGERILDIGCGNGYYLSLLNRLKMDLRIFGVDNDKRALSDARRLFKGGRIKLTLTNAEKLPFKEKMFDKIIISEVIEHVASENKVLNEAYRVLKTGGIVVLTTCNTDYPFLWDPVNWVLQHLFSLHIESGFWAGIWNQHLRLYKKGEVEKLIKKAGFILESSESLTSWCLPFNHYIVNFIARLFYADRLPKGISYGLNKFKNNKQPIFISYGLKILNMIDRLNDLFPQKNGVSIFVRAKRPN